MTTISPQLSNAYLEINTQLIKENILVIRSLMPKSTKLMVMVKAFGYGHGAIEISQFLEANKLADYLAVASIYKGIELREAGIDLPIMVTNPSRHLFEELIQFKLEPTIHHMEHLASFESTLKSSEIENYPVHLKFNTGMNRFGFDPTDTQELIQVCKSSPIKIASVMSHLSSADIGTEDAFTTTQIESFLSIKKSFTAEFNDHIDFHILNSNGILRFSEYAMDMVRSGIAIFGATEVEEFMTRLQPSTILKTKVAQVREVKAGESLSYARSAIIKEDKKIAIISIGYANGFPRCLSKGKWEVEMNGQLFPTIGNVCMDYTLIDISHSNTPINVEDTVIVFGGQKTVMEFAEAQDTIVYEALTNIGQTVDRLFI